MQAKRFDIVENPYGLCSDPSAQQAPAGSLSEASDCVKRRDGILQPRNGATPLELTNLATGAISRIFPVIDDTLLSGASGVVWASIPDTLIDDSAPIVVEPGQFRALDIRSNCYINTTTGLKKLTSNTETTALNTGEYCYAVLSDIDLNVEGTEWLEDGNVVAYRFTISKKDANGVDVESAPSCRYLVRNAEGDTRSVALYLTYDRPYTSLDGVSKLNVYRTRQVPVSVDPGDEMYRVGSVVTFLGPYETEPPLILASQSFQDSIGDNSLGESLYTNSTQQGILQRNDRPPLANEIALFNSSLFYADITFPSRAKIAVPSVESAKTATGDFTLGSPTILNVEPTTGLVIGQRIERVDFIPTTEPHYIESIVGTTVTMDCNALATNTGRTFYISDTLTIGWDTTRYTLALRAHDNSHDSGAYHLMYEAFNSAGRDYLRCEILDYCEPRDTVHYDPSTSLNPDFINVLISRKQWNTELRLWATNGDNFDPPLQGPVLVDGVITYDDDDSYEGSTDTFTNGIIWSKVDQPEHVPESNMVLVGDSSAIQRLIPLKDVLLIFKNDGLYGLTGYSADSGWSVQLLSPTTKLLRPDAACIVNDDVYAITSTGFVKISGNGQVTALSLYLFHNEIKQLIDALLNDSTETLGCWVTYDEKNQEVFFSLSELSSAYSETIYVYDLITQSFTTWTCDGWYHLQRGLISDVSKLLASGYSDQVSSELCEIDETLFGRDYISSINAFYAGLTGTDNLVVYTDTYPTPVIGNYLDYNRGSLERITNVVTDSWSHLLTIPRSSYALYAPYSVFVTSTIIYLITVINDYHGIAKIDKATGDLVSYSGYFAGTVYAMCGDSTYVYWTASSGNIYRWSGSGLPTILCTATSPRGIDVDSTYIYYSQSYNGKVYSRPKDGSGSWSELASGITDAYSISVQGTMIFWTSLTGYLKVRLLSGGTITTLLSGLDSATDFYIATPYLFYYTLVGSSYQIRKLTVADGTNVLIGTTPYINSISGNGGVEYICDSINNTLQMFALDDTYYICTIEDSFDGLNDINPTLDLYATIPSTITWLPRFGNTRALRKNFLAGCFVFSNLDGLSSYERRLESGDSYIETAINDTTSRYIVPIANARKLALEPSIKIDSAENANWELNGVSLEYTAQAPRGVKQ